MGNCPPESDKQPSMKKFERLYYSDYWVSTKTQKEETIYIQMLTIENSQLALIFLTINCSLSLLLLIDVFM